VTIVSIVAAVLSLDFARRAGRAESEATAQKERALDLLGMALEQSLAYLDDFHQRLKRVGGTSEIRGDMVERTIEHMEQLHRKAVNDLEVRLALARAWKELGDDLGHPDESATGEEERARSCWKRARDLANEMVAEGVDDPRLTELRADLALLRGDLAEYAVELDLARTIEHYREYLRFQERLHPDPASPERRNAEAIALHKIAGAQTRAGEFDAALATIEREREILSDALDENPGHRELRRRLAYCRGATAFTLARAGRHALALDHFAAHADVLDELRADASDTYALDFELAQTCALWGETLTRLGRPDDGERRNQRALELLETLRARDPADMRTVHVLQMVQMQLGNVRLERVVQSGGLSAPIEPGTERARWVDEARSWYERALETTETLLQSTPDSQLARAYMGYHRQAIARCDKLLPRRQ